MRMIALRAAACEEPPTEFLASAEVRASTTPVMSRSKTSLTALNSRRERSRSVFSFSRHYLTILPVIAWASRKGTPFLER